MVRVTGTCSDWAPPLPTSTAPPGAVRRSTPARQGRFRESQATSHAQRAGRLGDPADRVRQQLERGERRREHHDTAAARGPAHPPPVHRRRVLVAAPARRRPARRLPAPRQRRRRCVIGTDIPRSDTDFWNAYIKYTPIEAKALGITAEADQLRERRHQADLQRPDLSSPGRQGDRHGPAGHRGHRPDAGPARRQEDPGRHHRHPSRHRRLYMVVRADNRAYGTNACQFLGAKIKGKASVVMLEGGLDSINGRDRTEAFASCMKTELPRHQGLRRALEVGRRHGGEQARDRPEPGPERQGRLHGVELRPGRHAVRPEGQGSAGAADRPQARLRRLQRRHPRGAQGHRAPARSTRPSRSPPTSTRSTASTTCRQRCAGKTFQPGPTDHNSTIIQVRAGLLEDQLPAPLVTSDGGTYGGVQSLKSTDPSLWGNQQVRQRSAHASALPRSRPSSSAGPWLRPTKIEHSTCAPPSCRRRPPAHERRPRP